MTGFTIQHEYKTSDVREISVDYNGNNYLVIYGRHINGGFFSIPNWKVGGELSGFWDDTFYNGGVIGRAVKSKRAGKAIAEAIAMMERKGNENG